MYGQLDGIYVTEGTAAVTNAGAIVGAGANGTYTAVGLVAGGSVTNLSHGTISGANRGIYVAGGAGTVTNAGIISGVTAAVAFKAGFADRVIVDPGAVFSGLVNGGNTIGATAASTLELASGAAQGLMSGRARKSSISPRSRSTPGRCGRWTAQTRSPPGPRSPTPAR